jgi:hypothetical protein
MLQTYWTYVCTFQSAEQKPSLQVLDSIDNQDHAVGDDSNVICLIASHATHGVGHVAIHSRVAS